MSVDLKTIYIVRELVEGHPSPIVDNLQKSFPNSKIQWLDSEKELTDSFRKDKNTIHSGRDELLVYPFKGKFIHGCPGSDGMTCCNFFVINFGVNCIYDCHYCYLQTFLNVPVLTLFGNYSDLKTELDRKLANPKVRFRVGTGEYTDSLALDKYSGVSELLIKDFAARDNAVLELKTKSTEVDHLLHIDHRGHTVMSWSLNPDFVINTMEDGTSSLSARLAAAKRAEDAGYRLAFHFDPMVHYEGWENDYQRVVEQLFDTVNPNSVLWISIGSFRYSPGLKDIIQRRFPDDRLTKAEMIKSSDGKSRYFFDIRKEMYGKMKTWIGQVDERLFSYLCMETQPMWEEVYGFNPTSRKNLDTHFEDRRQYVVGLTLRSPESESA